MKTTDPLALVYKLTWSYGTGVPQSRRFLTKKAARANYKRLAEGYVKFTEAGYDEGGPVHEDVPPVTWIEMSVADPITNWTKINV